MYRLSIEESNKIIKIFEQNRVGILPQLNNRSEEIRISIPANFSVSDDPVGVIRFIKNFYSILYDMSVEEVYLDYSNCNKLGLSASVIMDVIALALDLYRASTNRCLHWEGNWPNEKYACEIVRSSGLPYHIGAEFYEDYEVERVKLFELVGGMYSSKERKSARVATELTSYLDTCLRTQRYRLNEKGKSLFSDMIGEVITNCEIHGGKNSTWYTQGYYKIVDESNVGEMQLVFLTIGESIYEGLKKEVSDETKEKLEHVMSKQSSYLSESWNEETLYTVLALQEGISRLRTEKIQGYEFRGSGTISLIERFFAIGGTKNNGIEPNMTIVSGHTHIIFTEEYKLGKHKFDNDPVFGNTNCKIIAFNEQNDIYKPADSNNVKYMDEYFPGTVISLKFYLDRSYIEERRSG